MSISVKSVALAGLMAVAFLSSPAALPASGELVYFASGGIMSVAGHRVDQETVVLQLHGGGEIRFETRLIDRIELGGQVLFDAPAPLANAFDGHGGVAMLARPYGALIQRASDAHGVNPYLIHAMIEVESGYDPRARSHKGAMGLMQLMPDLAVQYAVDDPYDPAANILAGAEHIGRLIDRYGMVQALAAYNAGEGAVLRFDGVPPYPETRKYLSRVLELVDANRGN